MVSTGDRLLVLVIVRSSRCCAAVLVASFRALSGDTGGSGDVAASLRPPAPAVRDGVRGGVFASREDTAPLSPTSKSTFANSGSGSGVTARIVMPSRYLCGGDSDFESPEGSDILLEYPGWAATAAPTRSAKLRERLPVEIGMGGRALRASTFSMCASIL